MDNRPDALDPRERRLNNVLGAYLEAADAGWAPDHESLERRYPDLASDLHAFFVAQSHVAALAHPCPANAQRQGKDAGARLKIGAETASGSDRNGGADASPVGDYEALMLIKEGGMGVVYKAWQ